MDKKTAKLLVVVAKEPVPGKVKTRFYPELSPIDAAGLYRCFLHDRIVEVSNLTGIDMAIAYAPEEAGETFAEFALDGFELFAQRGNNLGERLHNIFSDKFDMGYSAVSIVDSDSPDLPKAVMEASFQLLLTRQAEVVFGPCHDGGYYLVGMRRPHPELFRNIPWSTDNVLSTSLEKARKLGVHVKLLTLWNDLDTFEDLLAFYNKYKNCRLSKDWVGKQTFDFLSRIEKINTCFGSY